MNLIRKIRLESLLKRALSEFIKHLNFNNCLICITRAELSKDLKSAKIFISGFPAGGEKEALTELKKKKGKIKKYLGDKIKIKFLPDICFEIEKEFFKNDGLVAKR